MTDVFFYICVHALETVSVYRNKKSANACLPPFSYRPRDHFGARLSSRAKNSAVRRVRVLHMEYNRLWFTEERLMVGCSLRVW